MPARLVAGLLGIGAAVGLYALGWATGDHASHTHASHAHGTYDQGRAAGYADGRAQGVRDGRADVEVRSLPAGTRDAARAAFGNGYQAGANEVFTGYDGGWSYGTPYVVTLAPGRAGVTYRLASRTPMHPGVDYRLCPGASTLCQDPHR